MRFIVCFISKKTLHFHFQKINFKLLSLKNHGSLIQFPSFMRENKHRLQFVAEKKGKMKKNDVKTYAACSQSPRVGEKNLT